MNIIIIMPSFGQVSGVSVNIFDLDFLDLLDIADNYGTTCSLIVILSCSILNSLSSSMGPLLACLFKFQISSVFQLCQLLQLPTSFSVIQTTRKWAYPFSNVKGIPKVWNGRSLYCILRLPPGFICLVDVAAVSGYLGVDQQCGYI